MIIDAHVHVGQGLMNGWLPDELLGEMDRLAVDKVVIVPWDRAIAVDNERGNTYLFELCALYPNRFIPFCTVNPWWANEAVQELKRCVREGARGLKVHPVYQGFQLTDPILEPVLRTAVELGLPVYIPTGTPVVNMPLQLKHIAREYAEGVFIQGHFGSTDFWIDAVPSVMDCPNVYVDTAYNLPSAIENAIGMVGAERVIYSSDAPYLSFEGELEKLEWLAVKAEDKACIRGGNLLRILEGGGR